MVGPKSNYACSVDGCDEKMHANGFCRSHNYRWKTYGDPEGKAEIKPSKNAGTVCNVAGCEKEHYGGKGWCRKHHRQVTELNYDEPVPDTKLCKECGNAFQGRYANALFCSAACQMRWNRKYGCYTDEATIRNRGRCSHRDCRNGVHANGYCRKHNSRFWRHGDPEGGLPFEAPICSDDNCDAVGGRVSGLCPRHYHNKYYHDHHEVERARRNARRTRTKDATPPWADMAEIREIYLNCPDGYEVDHKVPLKGKNISGLHVPDNLQYLQMSENRTKSNKF